jgi:hypothetical protein
VIDQPRAGLRSGEKIISRATRRNSVTPWPAGVTVRWRRVLSRDMFFSAVLGCAPSIRTPAIQDIDCDVTRL